MTKNPLNTSKLSSISNVESYANDMSSNLYWKAHFFSWAIQNVLQTVTKKNINILDIWCASGDLIIRLKQQFPDLNFHWLDISKDMINLAHQKWEWWINFSTWNWYSLPESMNNTYDIIMWSSIMHEFWSYHPWNFSRESYSEGINTALSQTHNALKKWGFLLIKDPVKPLNDKDVKLSPTNLWNNLPTPELIIKDKDYPPHKIDITHRVQFFLQNFPWISQSWIVIQPNWEINCKLSVASEIARHVPYPITDTWSHFEDELNEWYGSYNTQEWSNTLRKNVSGLSMIKHKTYYNPRNHASSFSDHYDILWEDREIILPEEHLPTNQTTILRKI